VARRAGPLRDGLLVAGATVALVGVTLLDGRRLQISWLIGLSLAVSLPILLRRRLPLTAALCSAVLAMFGLVVPGWPGRLVVMGLFGMAAYHRRQRAWPVLLSSLLWAVVYGSLLPWSYGISGMPDLIVMGAAPVAVGYALRLHGERTRQTVRLHRAEVERGMAEERARLAREVHDSVGHHLTAIRMQATATRRAVRDLPPTADRTLGTIADLSAAALGEVRTLLQTLDEPGLGVAEIEHLARRLSASDLRIVYRPSGEPGCLPPATNHAAYRVAQEALTNAVRHSAATEVQVNVRRERARLVISIADDGPIRPATGLVAGLMAEGRGIRGMRERVLAVGGALTAGPREPHGWLVEADLPITGEWA
jgi:signal transduction histidine kinase